MRITESQLRRVIKRIIREQEEEVTSDLAPAEEPDMASSATPVSKDSDDTDTRGETPEETEQRKNDYLKAHGVKNVKDLSPSAQKSFKRGAPAPYLR